MIKDQYGRKTVSRMQRLREKGLAPNIDTFEAVCEIRGKALEIAELLEELQGGEWRIEVEIETGLVMVRRI